MKPERLLPCSSLWHMLPEALYCCLATALLSDLDSL
jgi:hypothetical protein